MMRTCYTLLGILLFPLVRHWLHRRAVRGKENVARMPERFGYAATPRPVGKLVWLHAASVGEAQSIFTLARQLLQQHPELHLLITTGTVTSAQLVAQQLLPRTIHQFVPVDLYPVVRRFLQHWQPDLVLWVESEFWPQMVWQVQDRKIPALLINARISQKTTQNWQRFPRTIRSILATFSAIYAGSAEDAAHLKTLGAQYIIDAGNLKFDAAPLSVDQTALAQLTSMIGGRHVWVAASTHAGEETQIITVHQHLLQSFPQLLTIIVPRHAVRGDEIAELLQSQSIPFAQRSKQQPIAPETSIYLADTMGELGLFYALSDVIFIGGSLIAHGGHNPLEAAKLNCAILTGPYTHNFTAMMQQFIAAKAIRVVADANALEAELRLLLTDHVARQYLQQQAQHFVQHAQGATSAILQHIDRLLTGKEV